jgi:hypothetical protein
MQQYGFWQTRRNLIILAFWALSVFLFFKQRFGDWVLSPPSGECLLSSAQSIELVPMSGHQNQQGTEYINKTT